MKCFYHSGDLDGHCSGAIVKDAFPRCELFPINYGDDFPWEEINDPEEVVYMVDYSLQPFERMQELDSKCSLVWIDHHKTVIEDYNKYGLDSAQVILVEGIGACFTMWQYVNMCSEVPEAVKLLAEYDVWNHSDPRTLPFQYGMKMENTWPDNQEFWTKLFYSPESVVSIINQGNFIMKYVATDNEKYAKSCYFKTELDGLRAVAVNKLLANSHLFDAVWNPDEFDIMLLFGYRVGRWTVQLYTTREDLDVSEVAKKRGGGGHKQAAGFQCDVLPFELNK